MPKDFRRILPHGVAVLHDPFLNKGTAFTEEERGALGLRGLLPPRVCSLEIQVMRVLENFHRKPTAIEKYIFLSELYDRNVTLFFKVVIDHIEEMMPIIYTPTVGQACQEYGHIFRRPRGIFLSQDDAGRVGEILRGWPHRDVRVIVVTDGERVLGLGDLGANGMGIPVGKLNLYTACGGVPPSQCLPVALDVGTENEALLKDPFYIGLPRRRLRGPAYDGLVDEFLTAAERTFPCACVQLEDFANFNAFRLLNAHRDRYCLFDDDIQGTAGVALAGLYAALRITGGVLADQRILFLGAGEAGIGIGRLVTMAMAEEGLSEPEARRRCWYVDSKGLVVEGRQGLTEQKRFFAHPHRFLPDLGTAVEVLRPTVLIGVSGRPGMFDRGVLDAMARHNARPIIFALSNPTSCSECTAEEAYGRTRGKAIFASGSPFPAVTVGGRSFVPGQGNNVYIFPGIGQGVAAAGARLVTDGMFLAAAKVLAGEVTREDLDAGRIYPHLSRIRDVSARIAQAVAETAWSQGHARRKRPEDVPARIRSSMYEPRYESYA